MKYEEEEKTEKSIHNRLEAKPSVFWVNRRMTSLGGIAWFTQVRNDLLTDCICNFKNGKGEYIGK